MTDNVQYRGKCTICGYKYTQADVLNNVVTQIGSYTYACTKHVGIEAEHIEWLVQFNSMRVPNYR